MTKISIIIPVYNVENFLRECLESVINQTLKEIEIICINDGSTDNSANILKEYSSKDNRFVIFEQENKGLSPSRNSGINIAKGEYIFFLDSDDYLAENTYLENIYQKAVQNNCDMLITKGEPFTTSSIKFCQKKINTMKRIFNYKEIEKIQVSLNNFSYIQNQYPCTPWGVLYKTDFVIKNKLFFINTKAWHEDIGYFIKCLSASPILSCTSNKGIMYRIHANSISCNSETKQKQKRVSDIKTVIEDAIDYIKTNHPDRAKELTKAVKLSSAYASTHEIKIKGLFSYYNGFLNKKLKVFNIPVYREKISNDNFKISILGIPLYQKKNLIKYYCPKT